MRGVVLVGVLVSLLPACSGDDGGDATGGNAEMTAGGADGASRGGAGGADAASRGGAGGADGGAASSSQGGVTRNARGGAGGAGGGQLSDDPGSGTCTDFTPCGGDVGGTWRIESFCFDTFTPGFPTCPEATVSLTISGTLTFQSDGMYIPRGNARSRTSLPASCSALCAASGCPTTADGGCVCEATEPVAETPLTYSTQGNQLILSPKSGVTQTAYYCRRGDELFLRGYSTASTRYQYNLRR